MLLGFNGGGKFSMLRLICVGVFFVICGFMVFVCEVLVFCLDVIILWMMFIDSFVDGKSVF